MFYFHEDLLVSIKIIIEVNEFIIYLVHCNAVFVKSFKNEWKQTLQFQQISATLKME